MAYIPRPPTFIPTPTPVPITSVTYVSGRLTSGYASGANISVTIGSSVDIFVTLNASASTTGALAVEVWKDIVLGFDQLDTSCATNVSLIGGDQESMGCSFVADGLTGGSSPGSLRQYYFKVFWNGVNI